MTQIDIDTNNNAAGDLGDEISLIDRASLAEKAKNPMEAILKRGGFLPSAKAGDIIEGVILEKKRNQVFVDLGIRGTGIIYGREFYEASDMIKSLKNGDSITGKIVDADNENGFVELSLKEAGREKNWADLRKLMEEGSLMTLKITEANKGGLILETNGVKGFLPVSQLSMKHYPRVEGGEKEKIFQELQKFIGQEMKVKIIDVNPSEEKLIFSEKEGDFEQLKSALLKYSVGDTVGGEVTGVVNFGAFVKFGEGLEGLIHISEIDWQLIEDPRDILKIGEKIQAKIIGIEGGKVSLSLKALKEDPWLRTSEILIKGETVKGKVTKFNPFGAFVEIKIPLAGADDENNAEIQGLAHISEFGTESKMRSSLELNKEYDFKILQLEPKEHRLSLGVIKEEKEETSKIEEK